MDFTLINFTLDQTIYLDQNFNTTWSSSELLNLLLYMTPSIGCIKYEYKIVFMQSFSVIVEVFNKRVHVNGILS